MTESGPGARDALKKALTDFLVEVLEEVTARVSGPLKAEMTSFLQSQQAHHKVTPDEKDTPQRARGSRFVSIKQAAEYWGTSPVSFRRMLDRLFAELPKGIVVRLGRRVRVDMEAFEAWLVNKGRPGRR